MVRMICHVADIFRYIQSLFLSDMDIMQFDYRLTVS